MEIIDEVEELGGMTKASESGMAKLRIEEAATKKQARIDAGDEVVVGVNKYRVEQQDVDVLGVDRSCRFEKVAPPADIRASRAAPPFRRSGHVGAPRHSRAKIRASPGQARNRRFSRALAARSLAAARSRFLRLVCRRGGRAAASSPCGLPCVLRGPGLRC